MSDVATLSKDDRKANTIKPMSVLVRGRVESSRSYDGKRYTQVMTPAADAYSRPQLVEIRSKGRLGERGEEVSISCLLGGFQRKAYEVKDKNTGEILKLVPVEHTLDAIENDV